MKKHYKKFQRKRLAKLKFDIFLLINICLCTLVETGFFINSFEFKPVDMKLCELCRWQAMFGF